MKSFDDLHQQYALDFSTNFIFSRPSLRGLFQFSYNLAEKIHFPILSPQVGMFWANICSQYPNPVVFEMGSGFGGSCFWPFITTTPKKMILTEKRDDLLVHYHQLPLDPRWKTRIHYHQGLAEDAISKCSKNEIDLLLIDGMKRNYLPFLVLSYQYLRPGASILIDNSFFGGGLLDPSVRTKKIVHSSLAQLHEVLKTQESFHVSYIPIHDGVFWLKKKHNAPNFSYLLKK